MMNRDSQFDRQQPQPYQPQFRQPVTQEPPQPRRRAQHRRRRRKTSWLVRLLALVGAATILVALGRYVIIPLLVYINAMGGGAL